MSAPTFPTLIETDLEMLIEFDGAIAVLVDETGKLDAGARRLNRLSKGAVARAVESDQFEALGLGKIITLNYPAGLTAHAIHLVKTKRRAAESEARSAGAGLGALLSKGGMVVLGGNYKNPAELALGLALRSYRFEERKSVAADPIGAASIMVNKPADVQAQWDHAAAVCDGVGFARDLVNEPANHLTTVEFANRLVAMKSLGLKVKVLEEAELEKLGMHALLGVGQGSAAPSKVVVMEWMGGAKGDAPFALVGKGVVFDTGGISLKPAGGMEDMTMDMGGAGTVAGAMLALAKRNAKANVVGIVGLVENMPDGLAQRPGDVVTSMKGDTIEVINTDAEGRLVLCDVLWYVQETYKPAGIIDLATLTGAIIIGLGHENAGVFSNDDAMCAQFLKAAAIMEEGAWRLPLGAAYDAQLKSRVADMKNVGGRPAGSITAAQFLARFIQDGTPWIHLDIAGVASLKTASTLAPKGATGWGVRALDRFIQDNHEAG